VTEAVFLADCTEPFPFLEEHVGHEERARTGRERVLHEGLEPTRMDEVAVHEEIHRKRGERLVNALHDAERDGRVGLRLHRAEVRLLDRRPVGGRVAIRDTDLEHRGP
jgi:hypothetical protein